MLGLVQRGTALVDSWSNVFPRFLSPYNLTPRPVTSHIKHLAARRWI